jgi:hypothetical protein
MPQQDLQEIMQGALDQATEACDAFKKRADDKAAQLGREVVDNPQSDHHVLIKDVYAMDQRYEGMKEILQGISTYISVRRLYGQ